MKIKIETLKIQDYFERYLVSHKIDLSRVSIRMAREIGSIVRQEYEKDKWVRQQKAIEGKMAM